jgi:hypothetical protein
VLSLALIKLFYSHRHSLYGRCAFVSSIPLFIIIPIIRTDFRAIFFRFTGIFRFANLSHPKLSSVALGKRPAGATFGADDNGELSKRSRKLVNPSDYMYIAPFRHFLYQRCARRHITIPDKNFPFYFISNERIRCIYCANMNKKYFVIKFYYLALSRYRVDIASINSFLDSRLL